jgi:hypothetical protein
MQLNCCYGRSNQRKVSGVAIVWLVLLLTLDVLGLLLYLKVGYSDTIS